MTVRDFAQRLEEMAVDLPEGSSFQFEMLAEDTVHFSTLRIASTGSGAGTAFLAKAFALCNELDITVQFDADATDLPGDPTTFELVRWYLRFGCRIVRAGDDCVAMVRDPDPSQKSPGNVMDSYLKRRNEDISLEDFDAMVFSPRTP